jgi:4-amino-4-deoxy-L-arabinose transferase-like glycosyltransferase
LQLLYIVLILLVAAGLRIADLTRLPPGFSDAEIRNIQGAESVRQGAIASLYNVGDPAGGYEGLYPIVQALVTSLIGEGLLCYRIVSLWCGLVSVALMYALARRLFGSYAGLVAAITLTVGLWPVLLSRSAIRETLLLPLGLAMLYTLARALHLSRTVQPNAPSTLSYTALGVLLSVMVYTHWTGLVGGLMLILLLGYLIATRQPVSRWVLSYSGFTLLVVTILGIPYLVVTLRSFPLSGLHVFWANRPENVGGLIGSTLRTLASVVTVGDPLPQHNLPSGPLIGPIGVVLLVIGLLVAIRRFRAPNMAFVLLSLVVGLLPGMWSRGDPSFANMILVLPAILALIGVGASVALQQMLRTSNLLTNWRAALLVATVTAGSVVYLDGALFRQWANDQAVGNAFHGRLGRLAVYLDHTHDNLTTSICTPNLRGSGSQAMSDPGLFDLMVHRQDIGVRFSDCMTALVLTQGGTRQRFAYADATASQTIAPLLKDWLRTAWTIPVQGLPDGSVLGLNVEKELADTIGKVILGHADWDPTAVGPAAEARLPVRMGGYLTFQGYWLPSGTAYKPGDTVTMVTYWRADGQQAPDLRVFAHILSNPNTEPAAQNDLLSVDASLLQDRDVFIQIIAIPLPSDFPSGQYHLSIGAYRSISQERLPVYDSNSERGNRLFLDTITVGG